MFAVEVSGGASIGSTFLFQLFNIRNTLVEQHRLALLLPCRHNFVRSRPMVACIRTARTTDPGSCLNATSPHGDLATEGATVYSGPGIRNSCSNVFEWNWRSMVVVNCGKSRVSTRDMQHTAIPPDFAN